MMNFFAIWLVLILSINNALCHRIKPSSLFDDCSNCKMEIVESIPEGLTFPVTISHKTTFEAWKELIDMAEKSIEIGSYYWTLRGHEYNHTSGKQGVEIFELLQEKGLAGNVEINITTDGSSTNFNNEDTRDLEAAGAANVRSLNFTNLINAGILHSKVWVVDRKHVYIGSANIDWRALTQVKELGVMVTNCPCIGEDLGKATAVYWKLGEQNAIVPEPDDWEPELIPEYNMTNPFEGNFDGVAYTSYISSSPPQMCPNGRTTDLDSIFDVIDNANEYIHVAVMDYFPLILYDGAPRYWSDIDDRLRKAAIDRRIKVKLLIAKWNNTRKNWLHFLKSLEDMNLSYDWVDVQIKIFEVPATEDQNKIPFARVNHNKYMVTEKSAYIGTSNWSGDYFTSTAGIGFVITPKMSDGDNNIQKQIASIFDRDWNSTYSKPISSYLANCPNPEDEDKGNSATTISFSNIFLITFTVLQIAINLIH